MDATQLQNVVVISHDEHLNIFGVEPDVLQRYFTSCLPACLPAALATCFTDVLAIA